MERMNNSLEILKEVNIAILDLMKSEIEQWVKQRDKLKKLLSLHNELINNYHIDKPDIKTINFLQEIKQWRTENLNTYENINNDIYGDKIMMPMSKLMVHTMANVYKENKPLNSHLYGRTGPFTFFMYRIA